MKRMHELNGVTFTSEDVTNQFPYFTTNLTTEKINQIINLSKCVYAIAAGDKTDFITMHCVGKYDSETSKSVSFAYFEMNEDRFDIVFALYINYQLDTENNIWNGAVNFSNL